MSLEPPDVSLDEYFSPGEVFPSQLMERLDIIDKITKPSWPIPLMPLAVDELNYEIKSWEAFLTDIEAKYAAKKKSQDAEAFQVVINVSLPSIEPVAAKPSPVVVTTVEQEDEPLGWIW